MPAAPTEPALPTAARRAWWPAGRRVLVVLFFLVVAALLVRYARTVAWRQVADTLLSYPLWLLGLGLALSAASHLLYTTFDLLGRYLTGHALSPGQVIRAAFVSYAFNLNFGAWVGGLAFRYRLYSQLGLNNNTITRIVASSLVTNWLGYAALAGAIFALGTLTPPPSFGIGTTGLRVVGIVLLAIAVGYALVARFSPKRTLNIRGTTVGLPSGRIALLQIALAAGNWLLMCALIFVLLEGQITFPMVAGVLLVSSIAAVATHIPAGLGVLEAGFVVLLGHRASETELLAALLAYRALYYLLPLLLAVAVYVRMETRRRRS